MDAPSPRILNPHAWSRSLILGVTLLLLVVASLPIHTPTLRASGFPLIDASPWMVTPAMTLSVRLNAQPLSNSISLRLYATLQQVGNQECPGARAVPGLPVLTITPPQNSVTASFKWPAQLGLGSWWLCTITT